MYARKLKPVWTAVLVAGSLVQSFQHGGGVL